MYNGKLKCGEGRADPVYPVCRVCGLAIVMMNAGRRATHPVCCAKDRAAKRRAAKRAEREARRAIS